MMYQNAGINFNFNAQTKRLSWIFINVNGGPGYNDFYEPREYGRVFHNTRGRVGTNISYESNSAKKLSWNASLFAGTGGVFKRRSLDLSLGGKVRFNHKFSVELGAFSSNLFDGVGYAGTDTTITGAPSIIFTRRDLRTVENTMNVKYNFTNKMGLSLRVRHYWSKVQPLQFYELNQEGYLQTPSKPFTQNANQNYNFFSVDMVYNWEFAQGSFFSIVWKDIAETFSRDFERNYSKNLSKTVSGDQFNSISLRVIYFLDYQNFRNKIKHRS